jgi:hypothetical protein
MAKARSGDPWGALRHKRKIYRATRRRRRGIDSSCISTSSVPIAYHRGEAANLGPTKPAKKPAKGKESS